MKPVFADTFYFLALINPRDAAHAAAVSLSAARSGPLLTTAWVLTEVADGLATTSDRRLFQGLLEALQGDPHDIVVPPTQALFERGTQLYLDRPDKQWS